MTDSDEVKLLPCPWCSEAWIKVRSENSACFYGECQGCAAHGPEASTRAEAIAAWNTRPPVVTDEVVERLALALGAALKRRCGDRAWADEKRCVAEDTILAEVDGEIDLLDLARAAIASMPAVVSGGQG